MHRLLGTGLAAVALVGEVPIPAQNQTTRVAVPDACELHVWPSSRNIAAILYNPIYAWRDRAFVGAHSNAPQPKGLAPDEQLRILRTTDLVRRLKLPQTTVIVEHAQPLEREAELAHGAHAPRTNPCHAELIVRSVVYQSANNYYRSIRVTYTYQRFNGGQQAPAKRFTSGINVPVERFPATKPSEVPLADAELESAFRDSLAGFAEWVSGPVAPTAGQ